MNRCSFTALAVLATFSGAAMAADPIKPLVPDEPIFVNEGFSWDGFYVGAGAGFGFGEVVEHNELVGDYGAQTHGAWGTLFAGVNMVSDNFLFGIEGDVGKGTVQGIFEEGNFNGLQYQDIYSVLWDAHLRGRVGVVHDSALFYVAGGLALAEFEYAYECLNQGCEGVESNVHKGITAGFGAEVAVTDNVTVRAEYLFDKYFEERYYDVAPTEFWTHTVRGGVAVHF